MENNHPTAFEYLQKSQKAFEQGDQAQARHWARLAVSLEPQNEEAWLWMGAIASPQASVGYLRRALEINPGSQRARQGMAWARKRISAGQMAETRAHKVHRAVRFQSTVPTAPPLQTQAAKPAPPKTSPRLLSRLNLSSAFVALSVLCLIIGLTALLNTSKARAFLLGQGTPAVAVNAQMPGPTPSQAIAAQNQPATRVVDAPAVDPQASPSPQPSATSAPTQAATAVTKLPTPLPTDTAVPTARVVSAPASQQSASGAVNAPAGSGQRILVSISQQHMWVYDGSTQVYSFVISTGMHNSTATGSFTILDKIPRAYGATWDLWMPDWMGIYYAGTLENGIHALPILSNGQTLWAGLLGQPASFGCIILSTADAKTLYDWANVGTPVIIQR